MQNLFAHTELGHDYPAVLSITKDDDGRHRVTVRSAGNGGRDQGVIHVSPETLEHMATDVLAAINGETPKADTSLDAIVDRFLCWKLPADFGPDCHIHFDREAASAFVESWPVGTNLLTADQAKQMFMHCVDLPASTASADIIRFTNGEDGVFAHVVAPNGNHFGVSIDALADGAGLQSKFFAAVADLVRAGALTPPEHQCCGKCEKPVAEQVADDFAATMEKSSRPGDDPTHYSGLGAEEKEASTSPADDPVVLRAVIEDLAGRLQTADVVILALLQKAGGEVILTTEDCDKVPGNVVTNDVSEDRSTFTFRAVPAQQLVA